MILTYFVLYFYSIKNLEIIRISSTIRFLNSMIIKSELNSRPSYLVQIFPKQVKTGIIYSVLSARLLFSLQNREINGIKSSLIL